MNQRDEPYDNKSDVWMEFGLRHVIYELTTLKPPFQASDMNSLFKKILKGTISRIPKTPAQKHIVITFYLRICPTKISLTPHFFRLRSWICPILVGIRGSLVLFVLGTGG